MCKIEQEILANLTKTEADLYKNAEKATSAEGQRSLEKITEYKRMLFDAMCKEVEAKLPRTPKGQALGKGADSLFEGAKKVFSGEDGEEDGDV